ncbi:MAG: 2Fe-2S iron-sulfur cluster binding domain-containing protein [Chitinivibrionales bacterium]|nr:2Fe-2S iron-sulfur cluster binding domain-containing protein [Chitinivibrionales bacterium]
MVSSILLSVLFLCSMGLILSGLLILAEKKILNYGECRISINGGDKELTVQGGSSLLSLLAENNIFIPSACGGRGSCAYCKVSVDEGGGSIGPVEEPYLSPEEHKNNVRLSCQVKVKNDIRIRVPKELFSVRKFSGRLIHKKPLTHDIVELRIELTDPSEINFVAGQYIQLESAEYKGNDSVMRAYSISSPPSDKNHIELIIRLVPGGICTTWVFEHLNEGQQVTFSGPYGEFSLSETRAPMICIAGGSGMAPIWSIIRDMLDKKNVRTAHYFFGALTRNDLFYVDELRKIDQDNQWFTYIPALSREPDGSDWSGEKGLITDVVARHFPDTSQHESYLCGSPGMIDACLKVLANGGIPEEKIFYDKFA